MDHYLSIPDKRFVELYGLIYQFKDDLCDQLNEYDYPKAILAFFEYLSVHSDNLLMRLYEEMKKDEF